MESKIKIKDGNLFIYRVFDVANEINLKKAIKIIEKENRHNSIGYKKDMSNTLIIKDTPLKIDLGEESLTSPIEAKIQMSAKIWSYGCISICLKFDVQRMSFKEFNDFRIIFDNSNLVNNLAKKQMLLVFDKIKESLIKPNINYEIVEDFSLMIVSKLFELKLEEEEKVEVEIKDLKEVRKSILTKQMAQLILGERDILSNQTKEIILKDVFQYTEQDLVIVDWNSALVFDLTDDKEFLDNYEEVLEFCLTHLLEFRIYDNLIDAELNNLYDAIEASNKRIAGKQYRKISKRASLMYIEFSDFLDKVNNSLKTVGNSYLASFLRLTSKKFRFIDWQKSIDKKLSHLARISELLQNDINSQKGHLFEIIIIILIAVEVIPFLYTAINGLLN